MQKSVLIFGISSFVGSNLADYLKNFYKVVGTYSTNKVSIPGVLTLPCDVLTRESVQLLIFTIRPDIVIYCAGLSSIDDCAHQLKYADALNTVGVFNVTAFSERYKARFFYISSAYIFSGENRIFLESDNPTSNTVYGKTKAASEFYIQKTCLNYVILRSCVLYGRSIIPNDLTWFESMERRCFREDTVPLDSSIKTGFLDIVYLGHIIRICIEDDISNRLFQISSKDAMTRYDFGRLYATAFNYSPDLMAKDNWSFETIDDSNGGIDSTNSYSYQLDINNSESMLGFNFPTVEESLNLTFSRWCKKDENSDRKGDKSKSTGSEIIYI